MIKPKPITKVPALVICEFINVLQDKVKLLGKGVACIYRIVNRVNNKVYVGSSTFVRYRFSGHYKHLSKGVHINFHLQKAWNKYGGSEFRFELIELVGKDHLVQREKYWVVRLCALDPDYGYNQVMPIECTEERGNKISLSLKGRPISRESIAKRTASRKYYTHSEETRKKISSSNQGHIVTKETREKISKANEGKKRSEEYKKRMSELNKGKKREKPEGWRENVAAANKRRSGRVLPKETREKISLAKKGIGHPQSEETKAKISASKKGKSMSESHRANFLKSKRIQSTELRRGRLE